MVDRDLQALESELAVNHASGRVVVGTGGLRKMRFAPPSWHRGKSGSTRVCFAIFHSISTVYLLTIFAKAEKDNLSAEEKAVVRSWIKQMKDKLNESEHHP